MNNRSKVLVAAIEFRRRAANIARGCVSGMIAWMALTGVATATLTPSFTFMDFGAIPVGTTKDAAQTLTLTGNNAFRVTAIGASGTGGANFSTPVGNGTCGSGQVFAANTTCTIGLIRFAPTSAGQHTTRFSFSYTEGNVQQPPITVDVIGTALGQQPQPAAAAVVQQTTVAQAQVAVSAAQAQLSNIGTHLDQLRMQRSSPKLVSGIKVKSNGQAVPLDAVATLFGDPAVAGSKPSGGGASADEFERWGAFINGNIERGRYDPRVTGQGSDQRSTSLTTGVDYRFSSSAVVGLGLGYQKGKADFMADGGNQDTRGYSVSLFGSLSPTEQTYIDLTLNGGRSTFDTRRQTFSTAGASTGTANSSAHGNQFAFAASFGLDLTSGSIRFNPYGRAEYIRATIDAFEESGTSPLRTSVGNQRITSESFTLGAQANYAISTSWSVVIPQARVEWTWSNRDAKAGVQAILVGAGATSGSDLGRLIDDHSYGNAGVGVTFQFPRGMSAFINYEQLFSKDFTTNRRLDIGIRIPF